MFSHSYASIYWFTWAQSTGSQVSWGSHPFPWIFACHQHHTILITITTASAITITTSPHHHITITISSSPLPHHHHGSGIQLTYAPPRPSSQFSPNRIFSWDDMHVLYFWKALGTRMLVMVFWGVSGENTIVQIHKYSIYAVLFVNFSKPWKKTFPVVNTARNVANECLNWQILKCSKFAENISAQGSNIVESHRVEWWELNYNFCHSISCHYRVNKLSWISKKLNKYSIQSTEPL